MDVFELCALFFGARRLQRELLLPYLLRLRWGATGEPRNALAGDTQRRTLRSPARVGPAMSQVVCWIAIDTETHMTLSRPEPRINNPNQLKIKPVDGRAGAKTTARYSGWFLCVWFFSLNNRVGPASRPRRHSSFVLHSILIDTKPKRGANRAQEILP